MSAVGHAECEDAYGHSRAAGLASSYVLCMVGATWHDDVDIDAIEVFVTAPQAEWAGEDGTFRVYKFRV